MNKHILLSAFCLIFTFNALEAQIFPSFGSERVGISIIPSLKIGVGARASAMGDSYVAVANDASSLFGNPAGMAQDSSNEAFFTTTKWLYDIKQDAGGVLYKISDDHVIGVSFSSVWMPNIKVTTETQPLGTGETFQMNDVVIGLSYSHKFTEQFSAGATFRYVQETIGKVSVSAVVADFGTYYWTGLGTSRFAVAFSNFGNQVKPSGNVALYNGNTISDFQAFAPPTVFRIGFALDPILEEKSRLTVAIQLNHPNDNAENYTLGAEYCFTFSDVFPAQIALRGGYKLNADEENFSAGIGLLAPIINNQKISIDYAYNNFRTFGGVHRFGVGLKF